MSTKRKEEFTEDAEQGTEQVVLETETFLALQSELRDFTSQTMHRLQSLSQSLKQYQQTQQSFGQDTGQRVEQDETDGLTPINGEKATINVDDTKPLPEPPTSSVNESPANETPEKKLPANDGDVDPMERLNAVKRRLEQRVQSTL